MVSSAQLVGVFRFVDAGNVPVLRCSPDAGQAGVCGRDFLDGVSNAPGHGRSGALGGAAQVPRSATEAERS